MHCDPRKVKLICQHLGLKAKYLSEDEMKSDIDFNIYFNLSKEMVDKNFELFFSKEEYGHSYCRRNGFYACLKIFAKYGYDYVLKNDVNYNYVFKSQDISVKVLEYIVENYHHDFDYEQYALMSLQQMFITRNSFEESKIVSILDRCYQLGAKKENLQKQLLDYLIKVDNVSSRWSIIVFFVNNPLVELDINKLICAYMMDDTIYMDIGAYLVIAKCNLDYTQDLVIKFALRYTTINLSILKKTLDLIIAAGAYDETQHSETLIMAICRTINPDDNPKPIFELMREITLEQSVDFAKISEDDKEEFLNIFIPLGINFHQMFADFVESSDTEIHNSILECNDLLLYLARKKDLLL
jgi:hypothetical protein